MTDNTEHPISIIRADHGEENPYFQYRRATAQDRKVSWAARGIMAYLLSRSDNWKLQPKDLQQKCGAGKVYTLLNELIAAQYIVRFEARDNKTKRIDHYKYVVYEKPLTEKQEAALPDTENRDITYKRVLKKKDGTKKDSVAQKQSDAVAADNGDVLFCPSCGGYRAMAEDTMYCKSCFESLEESTPIIDTHCYCGKVLLRGELTMAVKANHCCDECYDKLKKLYATTDSQWLEQHAVEDAEHYEMFGPLVHIKRNPDGSIVEDYSEHHSDDDSVNCHFCENVINGKWYRAVDGSVFCSSCWLKRDSDTPPALTAEQYTVLGYVERGRRLIHTVWTNNNLGILQSLEVKELVVLSEDGCWYITPKGRAALEAWQLSDNIEQVETARWELASKEGRIRERTADDGCDGCGGKVKAGSDAKCVDCGRFNSGLVIVDEPVDKPTMQEVDDLEATVEFWERVFGMLANIVHTPIPTTHPTIQDGSMFDLLNILANLDYVKLDSKDLHWKITAIGNTALEAYRQDKTVPECFDSKQVECSATEQSADELYATITADKDIAPETMEALGGMVAAAAKAIEAGTLGKPKAKKKSKAKIPKRTPQQKQTDGNMWEAVKHVWQVDDNASWKIARLQQWFLGTIKKTGRYKAFFDTQLNEQPADACEVVAFGHWYRSEYDNIPLPENGDKLRSHFETFRGSGERWQTFMRKANKTILEKIPKYTSPGIELEREQLNPVVEGEQEIISEEQQQEAKQIMQDLADKFGR